MWGGGCSAVSRDFCRQQGSEVGRNTVVLQTLLPSQLIYINLDSRRSSSCYFLQRISRLIFIDLTLATASKLFTQGPRTLLPSCSTATISSVVVQLRTKASLHNSRITADLNKAHHKAIRRDRILIKGMARVYRKEGLLVDRVKVEVK